MVLFNCLKYNIYVANMSCELTFGFMRIKISFADIYQITFQIRRLR